MQFAAKLRERIIQGDITTTIRLWHSPRVKVGGTYRMGPGHVQVSAVQEIALGDITDAMARASGFNGLADLLRTAQHGSGRRVFFIRFAYHPAPP